jgi:diaminohydroxyphosphoribosylaminopyrimidine deaminase/5-amino-6-(5-phosphoribosylamino)uracil reductase
MTVRFSSAEAVMRRALALAARGEGHVEPNPMVGAVLVDNELNLLGEGFHERFGGPHAEINALQQAGDRASGAALYVTLEPCCHHGKTPPCSRAVIAAGVERVIAAMADPAPHVAGGGIADLRGAGIQVEVGLLGDEAARLAAPFTKLVTTGLPWVHAKWAMTLDGKIASRTGASRWISGEVSRRIAHAIRGRMDAIIVGAGTVAADDPLLTPRPAGPRAVARIVVDSRAELPLGSQLVSTLSEAPVIVATSADAPSENTRRLETAGVEVLRFPVALAGGPAAAGGRAAPVDVLALLRELGRRRMTNVLVEGGGRLLGSFFDQRLIDEVHVFVAPRIIGGTQAQTPVAGLGLAEIPPVPQLDRPEVQLLDDDVYMRGRLIQPDRL